VSCWGRNATGALGIGSFDSDPHPTPVPVAGVSDAVQVTSGSNYACALRSSGAILCWGINQHGQLGNGFVSKMGVPVATSVVAVDDAIMIAGGDSHGCAVHAGGELSCWGWNHQGQLGDGTTTDSTVPVAVVGIHDVIRVVAGDAHSCAETASQGLWCWGADGSGQLGNGNLPWSLTPVRVSCPKQ
jgi:alpha-tubulin suppressor-like RCC1 family protein